MILEDNVNVDEHEHWRKTHEKDKPLKYQMKNFLDLLFSDV